MTVLAIIPARGGSKRLPRKNILTLGGVPLLERVVKTVIDSGIFDRVVVSTEDLEIAEIAIKAGAEVHTRPAEYAQDRSTVVDVCLDVLGAYAPRNFCCIYATSALLKPFTLKDSFRQFMADDRANVLMGVSEYNHSPVQALNLDEHGFAKMLFPEFKGVQSQLYPKIRVSNGTFYWGHTKTFIHEKTFYSDFLKIYDVPKAEVCDLDTPEDLQRLQQMFEGDSDGSCYQG